MARARLISCAAISASGLRAKARRIASSTDSVVGAACACGIAANHAPNAASWAHRSIATSRPLDVSAAAARAIPLSGLDDDLPRHPFVPVAAEGVAMARRGADLVG